MKKRAFISCMVAIAALTFAACGGGGGGGGGTPTATILDPAGNTVTTLGAADPVAAGIKSLSANTQYRVDVINPSGTVVCSSTVFTDNNGDIPNSQYCFLRDLDTASFTPNGVVNSAITHPLYDPLDDEFAIEAPFSYGKAVPPGDYSLTVYDGAGEEVVTNTIPIVSTPAMACASNATGLCARSFLKDVSNMYVTIEEGAEIPEGSVVDIYIINDRCGLGYIIGDTWQAAGGGVAKLMGVTVNYAGGLFTTPTPVWANPSLASFFDVVIDVDQSGTYTDGDVVEILDETPGATTGGLCVPGVSVQNAFVPGSYVTMQIAMDENRAYRDVFAKDIDDIYAQVQSQQRLVHKFGVRKYVVAHKDTWSLGDTLVDVIPVTLDVVQTGCTNQQRRLIAPIHLMSSGCYDVVFDVDASGTVTEGDAIDNIDSSGATTCGFIVTGGDGTSATIDSILDTTGAEVKDGTSDSISSKMTVTGTTSGFSDGATVKGYAVQGSNSSEAFVGTITGGAFTVPNVLLFSGLNTVVIYVTENLGTSSQLLASAQSMVTWNPGGTSGDIDIDILINWTSLTDMDTHFIKTDGLFTNREDPSNFTDCHFTNCSQAYNQALDWTTAAGSQTTSDDTSTGAIARLDFDCIGCADQAERAWISDTTAVISRAGNFLVCVLAYSGTDTPSAIVSINGNPSPQITAESAISSSSGDDMWFAGYISQDAGGNLSWNPVNQVGIGAAVCKQP